MVSMIGTILVKKRKDRHVLQMTFVDMAHEVSYKINKNTHWEDLSTLELEVIEAWGNIYYQFNGNTSSREKVFDIKRFVVKRESDSTSEGSLISEDIA